jgi:hypothetical protein
MNVVSMQSDEMDITTLEAPMGTGETFTAASTAVGLLAGSLTDRFPSAQTSNTLMKGFHSNATGFAFDVVRCSSRHFEMFVWESASPIWAQACKWMVKISILMWI